MNTSTVLRETVAKPDANPAEPVTVPAVKPDPFQTIRSRAIGEIVQEQVIEIDRLKSIELARGRVAMND